MASGDKIKSWKSSNKKVATVKSGVITAKSKGTSNVTVTLKSGKKATIKVYVYESKGNKDNKNNKPGKNNDIKKNSKNNNKETNAKEKMLQHCSHTQLVVSSVRDYCNPYYYAAKDRELSRDRKSVV